MTVHWKLQLICNDCGTEVEFRDERPEWQHDVELETDIEKAKAFVTDNKDSSYIGKGPRFVDWGFFFGYYVTETPPIRYAKCPACGGKCYPQA